MRRFPVIATAILCVCFAVSGRALADTVTIGSFNSTDIFPFGYSNYTGEYDQVYNSNAFRVSSPIDITAITFFLVFPLGPGVGTSASVPSAIVPRISGNYVLDLSTTQASAATLRPPYTSNIGPDNQLFTSGPVSNVLTFAGAPFIYDSSKGNLLLDVNVIKADPNFIEFQAGCSPDTNSIYLGDLTGVPGCATYGLVTQFTFAPAPTSVTPEPSSFLLAGTGVMVLAGAVRRRFL